MVLEQGKTYPEARAEVITSADIIDWYAEEGRRTYGRIVPGRGKGIRQLVIQEPIGVVAAFTPWNFPVLTPARKIGGALAAGCSLILKASEETPGACVEMVRCFADAGLPAGVLNLVFGVPAEVSEYLLAKDAVRKISFTGSIPVGKHLAALAAKGMKRTTMELGGHSPVVVFADADPEKAADTIAAFKYRNAGQVCISPTRFYVQEDVYSRFLKRFTEYANGIKLGDGLEKGITMGPMANARRIEAMEGFVNDAKSRGGKIQTGGKRHGNQGYFYEPTVITDIPDDAKVMKNEPFGPLAPVVTFKTFDEVVRARQLAGIRPRGLRFHHVERDRRRDRRRAGFRHGRRQLDRDLDAGDAVRRRQGKRPRQRRRHRGLGRLSGHQVHLAGVKRTVSRMRRSVKRCAAEVRARLVAWITRLFRFSSSLRCIIFGIYLPQGAARLVGIRRKLKAAGFRRHRPSRRCFRRASTSWKNFRSVRFRCGASERALCAQAIHRSRGALGVAERAARRGAAICRRQQLVAVERGACGAEETFRSWRSR